MSSNYNAEAIKIYRIKSEGLKLKQGGIYRSDILLVLYIL